MSHMISCAALKNLDDQDIVIFDCRFNLNDIDEGRAHYQTAHIEHAIYVHLNKDLSGPIVAGKTGRHPLPEKQIFAETLSQLGLKNNQTAIIYDDGNCVYAARMWWMLRWLGHNDVKVLDGGFKAWTDFELPVSTSSTAVTPTSFSVNTSLTKITSADALLKADKQTQEILLDARDPIRFAGKAEPIDAIAGHIPGAQCWPFVRNITDAGFMKSPVEIRQQFIEFGLNEHTATICYCGSGVSAAHNILALVHAGFSEPTLYAGSWSEWIIDPSRPIATDE